MKNNFEIFNEINLDLDEYEVTEISELEKEKMKRKFINTTKTNTKKRYRKVAASVAIICIIALVGVFSNEDVLARMNVLGTKIEDFLYKSDGELDKYKTIIGTTVENDGVKITLKEVIIDDGQIIINSLVDISKLKEQDEGLKRENLILVNSVPRIYIDGKYIKSGGGTSEMNIDGTINLFFTGNTKSSRIGKNYDIEIIYDNLYIEAGENLEYHKNIENMWKFKFEASGKEIIKEINEIKINKSIEIMDTTINLCKIRISPVSLKLYYNVNLFKDGYDIVEFKIEDQNGKELVREAANGKFKRTRAIYNINKDVKKVKLIPYVGEKTFREKAIDIDLDK